MKFISLQSIRDYFSFGGGNAYSNTPYIPQNSFLLTGQPEWIETQTENLYEIYMTTPQLYAVIQRRGYLLASGQWKHYNKDGEEIENSPFVELLENPNPLLNGNDFIRQWNENKCVFGNNYEYILKGFSTQEVPSGLSNLDPSRMRIKTTGKTYKQTKIEDIISKYELLSSDGGILDQFDPKEINHMRIVNGTNIIQGDTPFRPLFRPISNIRAAYSFRNVIMNKKGALGILSNSQKDSVGGIPVTPQERQRIEKEYQQQYGIDDKQMQVIITNSSLDWKPMSYPTKDLMLFEEVDADTRVIIDAYGLNDNIFSREKGSTFTNLAEGLKQAYQETIIPEAEELAMNRSKLFGLVEKGEFLHLDYSHIPVLQSDKNKEADILDKKVKAIKTLSETGLYSADEIKELIQL